jgi:hypothetical protein
MFIPLPFPHFPGCAEVEYKFPENPDWSDADKELIFQLFKSLDAYNNATRKLTCRDNKITGCFVLHYKNRRSEDWNLNRNLGDGFFTPQEVCNMLWDLFSIHHKNVP